jgi:hypothetical protein
VIIALIRKESASLLGHWLVVAVLIGLAILDYALGSDLTVTRLSQRLGGPESVGLASLLAFAVGHAVVAPDHAEGQIEFLDSLPTTRVALFAGKLVAAVAVVGALVVSDLALSLAGAAVALTPPGTSVVPAVLLEGAVFGAAAFSALGLGMALSWMRQLAWGVCIAALFIGIMAAVIHPPLQAYIPIFGGLGDLTFDSGYPHHAVGPVLFWGVLGAVGYAVAFVVFVGRSAVGSPAQGLATTLTRAALVGGLFLLMVPCGLCAGLALVVETAGDMLRGIEVIATRDFRVLHRPAEREAAQAIAAELDDLSARVGALVGHEGRLSLDVEMLGVPANHAGTFDGGAVRLAPDAPTGTLAHELAHAHAFALSGPGAWAHRSSVRFFDEGLADWVEARIAGEPAVPPLAAAIHRADPITLDLLVDDDRLVAERDLVQAYALGQAFVAALDDLGGAPARGCLLRELGQVQARRVAGLALWTHLTSRCDLDLTAVFDHMTTILERLGADLPTAPSVRATLRGDVILVAVDGEPADENVVCRFRSDDSTQVSQYDHVPATDGRCPVPRRALTGLEFDYQIGVTYADGTLYGRWVSDRLR